MATATSLPTTSTSQRLLADFKLHLENEGKRGPTVDHYIGASKQFLDFCAAEGLPSVEDISREHIELWLKSLRERGYKPHSVKNRFIGLRIFFRWLMAEDELNGKDPSYRINIPQADRVEKDVATVDEVSKVLGMLLRQSRDRKAPQGERLRAERDGLVIAILYDTGMRASELAELRTEHYVRDDGRILLIKTKNHRSRTIQLSPVGREFASRYLRHYPGDELPEYLLAGKRGRLTRSGLWQIVTERFREAGVKRVIGPHDLRHTSATHAAADGMSERDLMALYGWTDPEMARHYMHQVTEKLALEAHAKHSPLQRLMGKS